MSITSQEEKCPKVILSGGLQRILARIPVQILVRWMIEGTDAFLVSCLGFNPLPACKKRHKSQTQCFWPVYLNSSASSLKELPIGCFVSRIDWYHWTESVVDVSPRPGEVFFFVQISVSRAASSTLHQHRRSASRVHASAALSGQLYSRPRGTTPRTPSTTLHFANTSSGLPDYAAFKDTVCSLVALSTVF